MKIKDFEKLASRRSNVFTENLKHFLLLIALNSASLTRLDI